MTRTDVHMFYHFIFLFDENERGRVHDVTRKKKKTTEL